jgi:uncharacterized protein (TIGR01777 family)
MEEFIYRSSMPATAAELFDWHMRPGALERLTPPWDPVRIVHRSPGSGGGGGGVEEGSRVTLEIPMGPFHLNWVSRHGDLVPGVRFSDEQIEGPFRTWVHTHSMTAEDAGHSTLEDRITYDPPLGALGRLLASSMVNARLARMFRFRHDTLRGDLTAHGRYAGRPKLRIAVTGADGLIGRALTSFLTTGGHEVVRLVRRAARARDEAEWSVTRGIHEPERLGRIDACVHLAGENIGAARWTPARKAVLRESRVEGTRHLVESLVRLPEPPATLLCASAIGYYGARPGEVYEEDGPGTDFLSELCEAWEAAADPAARAGIRVVHLRTGIALSAAGGALREMLRPFRLGAGGPLGDGKQPMSWIGIDDVVGGYHHALMTETVWGPVNLTAPSPVSNAEFAATLGRVLRRPAILRAPAVALRAILGEMADPLLLTGSRVAPERLLASNYEFRHTQLEEALRHVLGRQR